MSKWNPPAAGILLLNTDAAYSSEGGGFGFILRDSAGRVLLSGVGPLHDVISVEHAEFLAMWHGFNYIRPYWEQVINIAADYKSIVLRLQQEDQDFTILGAVMDQFRLQLRHAKTVTLQHVPRSINRVAHRLAKIGVSLCKEAIWLFYSHHFVLDLIQNDWLCT